ncbi:uncharacterized protein LOC132272811 [Cornus florida]|uniref:uncharacterized protein LOC132272811 n=1 Tax=Cornus florida TaxID=4283 RepID=UPI002899F418|nr:uncharacterized protein LOC132272811 [Cornus florida]
MVGWVSVNWCLLIRPSLGNGCGGLGWRDIGFGGGWSSLEIRDPRGVGFWKFIRKGWDEFSKHIRFRLRDGRRICFWEDVWCGDVPLAIAFPQLYRIASDRQAMVVNCYHLDNGRLVWDVRFRRSFQDWEIEEAIRFLELLYRQRIVEEDSDYWSWVANSQGCFEVRSFFRCLSLVPGVRFPWKFVWRSKAPLKVAFFVWTSVLGRILTQDNLRRRSQVVVNRWFMCLSDEESVDHLLIHCSLARECWDLMLGLFGFYWVMPGSARGLIEAWRGCPVGALSQDAWKSTPLWRDHRSLEEIVDFLASLKA